MSKDRPADNLIHWLASIRLLEALEHGTPEDVIGCLRALKRLDGRAFKTFVQQVEGTLQPESGFRNQFKLVGLVGRPPHKLMRSEDLQAQVRSFYEKLRLRGHSYKDAIFKTAEEFEAKESIIKAICK